MSVIESPAERAKHTRPDVSPKSQRQESSVLGCEGLRKSYRKRTVVKDVTLDIHQGEIVGLLGPNGAGKTTVFYMIVGLEKPNSGRILLDSKDISRLPMYLRARDRKSVV